MRRAKKKSQAKKICSLQGKGSSDGPSHLSWISGKGNGRTVERLQKNVKIQSTRSTSQVNICQHRKSTCQKVLGAPIAWLDSYGTFSALVEVESCVATCHISLNIVRLELFHPSPQLLEQYDQGLQSYHLQFQKRSDIL